MPQDKPALAEAEIDLIRSWIAQGAVDDTPAKAPAAATTRSTRPSTPGRRSSRRMDFSPDGQTAGRRRLPRGPALQGRRLGARRPAGRPVRADRVGPVLARRRTPGRHRRAARPDGRGPGLGRRQAEARCCRSPSPSTRSTARAGRPTARRSPSAAPTTRCGPSTPRPASRCCSWARTTTGSLDTVFSADGSHLVSVGRDMAAKLTEVATQRFVDNITSITPGRAQGGHRRRRPAPEARRDRRRRLRRHAQALPRLPPDGPRHRRRLEPDPRVPGDDRPRLQRRRQPRRQADRRRQQPRRRRRGRTSTPTSSTPSLPDNIKAIMAKVASTRSAEEKAALEKYHTEGVDADRQDGRRRRPASTPSPSGPTASSSPRPAATGRSG